jgi:hypothetical protein
MLSFLAAAARDHQGQDADVTHVDRSRARIGGCAAVYCARPATKNDDASIAGLRAMRTSLAPAPARCQALVPGLGLQRRRGVDHLGT